VVGTVAELRIDPPFDPNVPDVDYKVYALTDAEEYLKGDGPASLELLAIGIYVNEMGDFGPAGALCQLIEDDAADRRYVLFFDEHNPLARDPGYCGGSRVLIGEQGEQYLQEVRGILAAAHTPTASPGPTESLTTETATPTLVVTGLPRSGSLDGNSSHRSLILSVIGASLGLAFLGTSAFLFHRRRA
jgi:hypothetical protein